jgi:hypothetical protein
MYEFRQKGKNNFLFVAAPTAICGRKKMREIARIIDDQKKNDICFRVTFPDC